MKWCGSILFFVLAQEVALAGWFQSRSADEAASPQPAIATEERCDRFSAWGEFLYWKTTVSNWPYAVVATVDNLDIGFQFVNHEARKEVRFHYDPGFRVGLAGHFNNDCKLQANYTRFLASAHVSKTVTAPGIIFTLWNLPLPAQTDTISAHQSLKLSQLNLDVVKRFAWGQGGSIEPFFGALGAMIHQRLSVVANQLFDPPSIGEVKTVLKNHFTGGGLELGLAVNYTPASWFTLCGKGSYGLLYGKFKLKYNSNDTVNLPPEISIIHRQGTHEWSLVNMFDVTAGIKFNWMMWDLCLSAYADYEFVFWPTQMRTPRIQADVVSKTPLIALNNDQGDVGFHGVTAGLVLRF